MSYIELVQKLLKEILETENISIGKIKPTGDVIYLRQTGGKGLEKCQSFRNSYLYEAKIQIMIYNDDLLNSFRLSDLIEHKLNNVSGYVVDDVEIFSSEKISGPIDLGFDEKNRKLISLNYIINFVNAKN
ncbi:hypothetical protein B5E87_00180 [Massilimicrobiota sp. An142]|uniref:phage tail terminator protein n=1 Tax=Massilimicrobiota sp. An142 TaxID=1965564 RepID=UPI000B3A5DF0|nr:minor capsid protein [Massilimicrobiota sp. An142]OUQ15023.1 hypothetical protein B5E87_00180 [Massilimicrobiota sp. An142]